MTPGQCQISRIFEEKAPPGSKTATITRHVSITCAESGTILGEECFLDSRVYLYTVTAKSSEVRLLELPRSCMKELIANEMYADLKTWNKMAKYFHFTVVD